MTIHVIGIGAAVLALALGLGLKAERYAGRFADHSAENQARVAAVLASEGWLAIPNAGTPLPFAFATFAKPGCGAKLMVARLGSSRELVDEVRLALGPDVGFIETTAALGLLAVAPASASNAGPCSAPSAGRWR